MLISFVVVFIIQQAQTQVYKQILVEVFAKETDSADCGAERRYIRLRFIRKTETQPEQLEN